MNWDQIQGKWKQFRGQARGQWGELTNDEVDQIEGERDQLVGKIQERYGTSREEAEQQVERWVHGLREPSR